MWLLLVRVCQVKKTECSVDQQERIIYGMITAERVEVGGGPLLFSCITLRKSKQFE